MAVSKTLESFARTVVTKAKANLNASFSLRKSIFYNLEIHPNSFTLEFLMPAYGVFHDKGVSGTQTKYRTDFRYTNKMPPPSAFDKWSVKRGLAPRDEGGRFTARRSLNFALAMHVYRHGLRPTHFFTRPFRSEFEKLPDDVVEAYGLEIDRALEAWLEEPNLTL